MTIRSRIHRTTSADGTEIAGRVDGQGPPLVLVHGSLEDGDCDWTDLLPLLRERFTCYLMSTRSRGLSGDSASLSRERRVQDVTAFIESIGEPVHLFGESDGAVLALGAAARSTAVTAVAAHEPPVFDVFDEETALGFERTIDHVATAVADGDLTAAVRSFLEFVANDEERAALADSDYIEQAARYMPTFLAELEQDTPGEGRDPTSPSTLATITVPVLLLHSARSARRVFFSAAVRHVARHVGDVAVRELPGSGHWAVTFAPELVADELATFFASGATASA